MQKSIFLVPMAALVCAGQSEADPASTVQGLVRSFVIPRFQAVADATAKQQRAWKAFCETPNAADFQSLRQEYQNVADAWAKIEFIRIGPAAAQLRVERFNYWLDRRNDTGHALDAMLADPKALEQPTLAQGSVAGQGMPILERLLYADDDATPAAKDTAGERRCAVGKAVAANLNLIAVDISGDWTRPGDGAGAAIFANKGWGASFTDAGEAASVILTDLVNGLDVLKDFKLAMMFHDIANPGAPRLAENARSGRFLRDIQLNFAAVRQAMDLFLIPATPTQRSQIDAGFTNVAKSLDTVADAERGGDRDKRMAALQSAISALGDLKQTEMSVLPAATEIPLGFNNLDGD